MVRSDAARNRAALVGAATDAFLRGEADITLEQVARDAGVGIGTLYRNFPTREALLAAVYATGLDDVCAAAGELLDELPPAEALRAWMDRYAAFVGTKRGMAESLRAMRESGALDGTDTVARLNAAIGSLLDAGASAGTVRRGVDPDDVSSMLVGLLWSIGRNDRTVDQEQLTRMLDLVFAGLRG